MDATSRAVMLRDIASDLAGQIGQIPTVGTSDSGGSTTTLVDSTIAIPNADTDFLDGVWLMIDEKVGSGPAAGEVKVITSYAAGTGTLTTAAFSATIETGTDYSLWRHIHPNVALRFLQQALRAQTYEVEEIQSLLINGHFEDSAFTTFGAATGDDGAVLNTAAPFIRHGKQSLKIGTTADDKGVQSVSLRVVGGKNYVLTVAVLADAGTAKVQVYDVTASGVIAGANAVTWAGEDWGEVEIQFTVPDATELIRVDLLGASGTTAYFDDANLHRLDQVRIYSPDWLQDPSDLESIGYYARGAPTPTSDVFHLDEQHFLPLWNFEDHVDEFLPQSGTLIGPFSIELPHSVYRPLWIKASRPYPELAAATDTTTAPRKVTVNTALWYIYGMFAVTAATENNETAIKMWLNRQQAVGQQNATATRLTRSGGAEGSAKSLAPGLY